MTSPRAGHIVRVKAGSRTLLGINGRQLFAVHEIKHAGGGWLLIVQSKDKSIERTIHSSHLDVRGTFDA